MRARGPLPARARCAAGPAPAPQPAAGLRPQQASRLARKCGTTGGTPHTAIAGPRLHRLPARHQPGLAAGAGPATPGQHHRFAGRRLQPVQPPASPHPGCWLGCVVQPTGPGQSAGAGAAVDGCGPVEPGLATRTHIHTRHQPATAPSPAEPPGATAAAPHRCAPPGEQPHDQWPHRCRSAPAPGHCGGWLGWFRRCGRGRQRSPRSLPAVVRVAGCRSMQLVLGLLEAVPGPGVQPRALP